MIGMALAPQPNTQVAQLSTSPEIVKNITSIEILNKNSCSTQDAIETIVRMQFDFTDKKIICIFYWDFLDATAQEFIKNSIESRVLNLHKDCGNFVMQPSAEFLVNLYYEAFFKSNEHDLAHTAYNLLLEECKRDRMHAPLQLLEIIIDGYTERLAKPILKALDSQQDKPLEERTLSLKRILEILMETMYKFSHTKSKQALGEKIYTELMQKLLPI
jgi:hypothetical protein